MASGQGTAHYVRSAFGSHPPSHTLTTAAPYSTQPPAPVPPPLNLGMPIHNEASSQPPPLPSQSLRQPTGRHTPPGLQLPPAAGSSHGVHAQSQNHSLARQLQSLHQPTHIVEQQGHRNGHHQIGGLSQPLVHSQAHSQAQQRPYTSYNAISNLLPGSTVTSLSGGAPQGHGQQNVQGMQNQGIQNFPFHGMSGMDSYQMAPGPMPGMQSLINPNRMENTSHAHTNTHHTSSTVPHSQHLGTTLSSSLGPGGMLLNGAVDKRRRNARARSDLAQHLSSLKTEDQHAILLGPSTKYDPAVLLPTTSGSNMPIIECDGIQFKPVSQLPEAKIRRLRDEKIKPVEHLTFDDIRAYNRNQLRAYCFVYGVKRKRKAEMEESMAKYASLFHPGDPAFDFEKFTPAEYKPGAIPRRRIPVTKEQRERSAGDALASVPSLPQRPSQTFDPVYHAGVPPIAFAVGGVGGHVAQPPPLPPHPLGHPRAFDVHSAPAAHHLPQQHPHQPGVHQHQHGSHGVGHAGAGDEMGGHANPDMIGAHDPLHVSNQLLGLSNQIHDE